VPVRHAKNGLLCDRNPVPVFCDFAKSFSIENVGYNAPQFIRIGIREPKYQDILFKAWETHLKN
jgi:hypothetical protein